MLVDFYIPRLSNDMKMAIQKNHLGAQILYRSVDPAKKRRPTIRFFTFKYAFKYVLQIFLMSINCVKARPGLNG